MAAKGMKLRLKPATFSSPLLCLSLYVSLSLSLSLLAGCVSAQYGPDPDGLPADAKCAWRTLAYNAAVKLRPDGEQLYRDSLQLDVFCGSHTVPPTPAVPVPRAAANPSRFPHFTPAPAGANTEVYADPINGDDSNPGTQQLPKKTIQGAVNATRARAKPAVIYLRKGTFYQREPVVMTAQDSNITIQNYNGEEAWVSGGVLLSGISWQQHDINRATGNNIWKADLSSFNLDFVHGLRVDGRRVSPARYPNADPETQFWPIGYLTSEVKDWHKPKIAPKPNPAQVVEVKAPNRDWDAYFSTYGGGIGGTCSIYDPPFSYWCQSTFSEGCGGCFTWNIPGGFDFHNQLPKNYTKWQDGYFMAWRQAHWANWAFEIADYDPKAAAIEFGRGGFQGARGGPGSDWFVMNIFDELDVPTEYFYDRSEKTLYYFANNTQGQPPSSDQEFVAVIQHMVFNVSGSSKANPIKGVTFRSIGIRDTAWTMLEPHGVPSGGDWALERFAALFVENSEDTVVDGIEVTRVGGNAVMFSKYNLRPIVQNSSFAWLGGSAIALWGWTDEITDGGIHGIDSTAGNFPRYALIRNNICREIGVWEKQSSCVFQAKSAQTTLMHNVVFNLGRAGFNFNDGHGGGDLITQNVLWHTCRESSDHGPINSWDRQPFLTTVRNGTASTLMAWRNVSNNLVVANYGGSKEVDNDDGSLFWHVENNVMFFGWGQKFKCGAIHSVNNLKAYIDLGGKFDAGCLTGPLVFEPNLWHDDIMIHLGHSDFDYRQCWGSTGSHDWDKTQVYNNTIYLNGTGINAVISCGRRSEPLPKFQSNGNEPGSKQISQLPPVDTIVQWAKQRLF